MLSEGALTVSYEIHGLRSQDDEGTMTLNHWAGAF